VCSSDLLGGTLSAEERVAPTAAPTITLQDYRVDLTAAAKPSEDLRFFADGEVRALVPASFTATSVEDLIRGLSPRGSNGVISLDLREAYLELKGFLFKNVDLKIGRQRIAWGTADMLNPTDNINPYDLQDVWDFGRHRGSDGVQANVYLGPVTVTALAVPTFSPAVLPEGGWASAFTPSAVSLPFLVVTGTTLNVVLPDSTLAEGLTVGGKVKASFLGIDASVSYLYARDSLPLVNAVTVAPAAAGFPPNVDVTANLVYPREHIFGADLAASLFSVGVWAEAAMFVPQQVILTTDTTLVGGGVSQTVALASDPYVKFVVGADYTFPGNVYVNVQYLHGFLQQRGAANLEDFFVANLDWKLLDDALTISPLGVVVEIKSWSDVPDNYAVIAAPCVSFKPADAVELKVGAHLIVGTASTMFGAMSGSNEIFLKATCSF
jgi:hypothetical protein